MYYPSSEDPNVFERPDLLGIHPGGMVRCGDWLDRGVLTGKLWVVQEGRCELLGSYRPALERNRR